MKILGRILAVLLVVAAAACARNPGAIHRGGGYGGGYVGGTVPALGDAAPHLWKGGHPYNHEVHGMDISRYQGNIDWRAARQAGISFAFIKATEGGDHSDPAFRRYWQEAGAAGVPRGAYHYYYFCRSGAEQAAWYIANVPRERGALPPVVDLEWTHKSQTCRYKPSPEEVRREASSFINLLHSYYGQRPIIYTTVDFYHDNNLGRVDAEFWLRSVAAHPSEIYPGQRWSFWQYTGTGLVPGIEGRVDLNAFAGNRGQWQQWLNRRSQ
ncbi:glycoside hydrolase family 25 protein [Paracoccus aminophilus]|uniref:Glycoside hydrolase n=1 Tax=Paracoccus aminophilus JCM 7686 TaxID=1367847 RepID=S5YDI6_PARAH|nr:GH25 family lysozyme [Paracoccus aminophilus]AGT09513.1 glycoside hydrolase [Paracoccus aminophilus JCM 7686]